jgi:hypothetical protein
MLIQNTNTTLFRVHAVGYISFYARLQLVFTILTPSTITNTQITLNCVHFPSIINKGSHVG